MSELGHDGEELKQPENQHVVGVGYMKEAQQLFAQIKSPKPLCNDPKVMKKVYRDVLHLQRRGILCQDSPEVGSGSRN